MRHVIFRRKKGRKFISHGAILTDVINMTLLQGCWHSL
uniref:Uncharacterized protein n=1 Tax=Arundo donax TaxID=35708 RepID=A0A0A9EEH3_ARUDO